MCMVLMVLEVILVVLGLVLVVLGVVLVVLGGSRLSFLISVFLLRVTRCSGHVVFCKTLIGIQHKGG